MNEDQSKYPESDKILEAVKSGTTTVLTDFYDWLGSQELQICRFDKYYEGGKYIPDYRSPTDLFADFLGIDMRKVEREKRKMLAECRKEEEG